MRRKEQEATKRREHEEEMKRLRMELASEGAYNQVSFSYDGTSCKTDCGASDGNQASDGKSDFKLPSRIKVPEGIPLVSISKQLF